MTVNPKLAQKAIADLARVFRQSLSSSEGSFSTIEEECDNIKAFLEIGQLRFGERLQFQINISPDCRTHKIPTLLIQPLVENSIKHGIEPSEKKCTIKVSITNKSKGLEIIVSDDGVGWKRKT